MEIVDEQAHAHAALGRIAHRAQQQPAGGVVGDVVGLQVERALRAGDQFEPGRERVMRHRDRAQRRLARRDGQLARERRQRRIGRGRDAGRYRPFDDARQAGTAAHQQRQHKGTQRSHGSGRHVDLTLRASVPQPAGSIKPAAEGYETPWHQDGHYWPIRPLANCTRGWRSRNRL
ncbi:phytanoyl-CoA dioxygenase family protein [Variovorax sp. LjRoot84]|uniref:hypothetical protein n=1 Tax=Variovorax sp. LjRoot84 TaxID=3342340 RepID=UPI003ED00B10